MSGYYADMSQAPMLAPASYSSHSVPSDEVSGMTAHAAYTRPSTWLGSGIAVASIASVLSFGLMWVINPSFVREAEGKRNAKWPAIYAVVLGVLLVSAQRMAGLRSTYGTMLNPHVFLAGAALLLVIGASYSMRKAGASTGVFNSAESAVREGVLRAKQFVDAADANPDHAQGMQQAALAEGHLFAFREVYGDDKLGLMTGVNTSELAERIRSVRSSYYA